MAICGTTTNSINFSRSLITGPNLFLFAYSGGPATPPEHFSVMRLYSLKIYEDSGGRILTHDFVPVRRIADNAYGLYDRVALNWCPNGSVTPLVAGPVVMDNRLVATSPRYAGRMLSANLMRGGTAAVDVYAAWGTTYGGIDAEAWQHTARCGSFAEGVQRAKFSTPAFGRDTVYVRFYTADGEWTETIYLPEQPRTPAGLIIHVK